MVRPEEGRDNVDWPHRIRYAQPSGEEGINSEDFIHCDGLGIRVDKPFPFHLCVHPFIGCLQKNVTKKGRKTVTNRGL